MARYFSCLLIIFGLEGFYTKSTVSKVSVEAGRPITVPCNYDVKYKTNVKYLCKGGYWRDCSYAVKTNEPDSSGKFLISDDKNKNIFTVTINDLTDKDAGYYWCAVEINHGADSSHKFNLSVTKEGSTGLYVEHQEVKGFIGDSVNIKFNSSNAGLMKVCRLNGNCVTGSSGSIDGTTVSINVTDLNVFTVTMSELKSESSGWYVFDRGDLQMPIHLNVTEKPATAVTSVTHPGAVTTFKNEQRSRADLKSLIIPLSLLIFVVIVTVIIWFMLKNNKQRKVKSPATVMEEEDITYCDLKHKIKTSDQAGNDAIYCNVGYVRGTSVQMSNTDVDVMYSSVVTK